jgi:uncharacterized protein with ParB-like and HNH nuclease domain
MQAQETKLQPIFEGTKQYVIPLFQRPYSWEKKWWDLLWNDLCAIYNTEKNRTHFIGSIVTMPTVSVPEGVTKYLLIDGQQRLTTIFILLTLLRDLAKDGGQDQLSEEINNTLLVNPYKKGVDYFKLLPTHDDRGPFQELISEDENKSQNLLLDSYLFFKRKFKQHNLDIQELKSAITNKFSIVSIVLEENDNPYLVFESLNAKGRPLSQADLIRNFIFMRIHVEAQDLIYSDYWKPMQDDLRDHLTEFIRHYLMKDGASVKESDVYFFLKDRVGDGDVKELAKEISKFAKFYKKLLEPSFESNSKIERALRRLNQLSITTAYPFLLNCYRDFYEGRITEESFHEVLKIIENFVIRRFICSVPTNQLGKIFTSLYSQIAKYQEERKVSFVDGLKCVLEKKNYPSDAVFQEMLANARLCGTSDRASKGKLVLESIEEFYGHKEGTDLRELELVHIIPADLVDFQEDQDEDIGKIRELYIDVIGNLTLSGYSDELANESIENRKNILEKSKLDINKFLRNRDTWNIQDIRWRSQRLSNVALSIWPYFGSNQEQIQTAVTGKTPSSVMILGQIFSVDSWRKVLVATLDTIYELEPEAFEKAVKATPKMFSPNGSDFRAPRELRAGYFVESNMSAKAIQNFCNRFIDECGLSSEDWEVMYS